MTSDKLKDFFLSVIDNEIESYTGTSTHGNCCTCQKCKQYHDDCTCAEIEALKKLKEKLATEEK